MSRSTNEHQKVPGDPDLVKNLHPLFLDCKGVSTDSREELQGKLFFAIKGERFDGNRFVSEAVEKGCRLAVTERKELEGMENVLVVPSVLQILQELARYHRFHVSPRVLAITGSNGKTTTKELAHAVLSTKYRTLATSGNLNNHIGVPLTLLSLKDEEMAIIEMGANHAGEIGQLAGIAAPETGVITNVGKAHLEGFGSLEGVLHAKGELYEYLASGGGTAIIDITDDKLRGKASAVGVDAKLAGPGGDIPVSCRMTADRPFLSLELQFGNQRFPVSTRMVGPYNLQNVLLAASVGYYFGTDPGETARAISGYQPINRRSQLMETRSNRLILDSYNANPTSMREAIGGLLTYDPDRSMVILGDMAELGEQAPEEHRQLVEWIRSTGIRKALLAGPHFSRVARDDRAARHDQVVQVFPGTAELAEALRKDFPSGYSILVKGSRIMRLEEIVDLFIEIDGTKGP